MKLIHISDLHIGIKLNEYSLTEDQTYILTRIINIIDDEKPDAVLIAGDIYDRLLPSAEAVSLFDDFIVRLSERNLSVFVISGNHDSPERIAFGSRIMDKSGIHFSPVYTGTAEPFTLSDSYGDVCVYMLPYIKPAHVKRCFPDEDIDSYNSAMKAVIGHMKIDVSKRNILVTHQFITGAAKSGSEEITIGGTDNIDADVFDIFDYLALGHIHNSQYTVRNNIRYCGTPLKYSFSEIDNVKSVTVVEMKEKGILNIREIPLKPLRDMKKIRGTYMELTAKAYYDALKKDEFMYVVLTDEEDVPDAINKLRVIYPNILKLEYDNARSSMRNNVYMRQSDALKLPHELFAEFYELQNNKPMTDKQTELLKEVIDEAMEERA